MAADRAREAADPTAGGAAGLEAEWTPDHRALCAWVGGLSSHRQGLIGRLVRHYGTIAATLSRHPDELALTLGAPGRGERDRRSGAPSPGGGARLPGVKSDSPVGSRADASPGLDASAYQALLREAPATYLRRLEGRGPGHSVVTWCDALYPPMLRHLPDPPLCLFIRHACPGAVLGVWLEALGAVPVVAVVGARSPSLYGAEMAALLGRDLTRSGALVISGLAMGIDALAQRAAADAAAWVGRPATVAVLGCGADVVYPRVNAALQARIVNRGMVLSEFAWGVPARAWRFPARNRVIAALAQAVVIVEGTERSGARITADFALDLGREVLAVPGEAGRRLSAAPHSLLRQGAGLCESAADVLDAIAPPGAGDCPTSHAPGHDDCPKPDGRESTVAATVLRLLQDGPLTVDQIAQRCAIPVGSLAAALSELEVDGLLSTIDGGGYRLRRR
jgi:DNA processing protein